MSALSRSGLCQTENNHFINTDLGEDIHYLNFDSFEEKSVHNRMNFFSRPVIRINLIAGIIVQQQREWLHNCSLQSPGAE